MVKKVLILKGSMRKNGNTDRLADEFERGVRTGGAEVTSIALREKRIDDCSGCGACQLNGGTCVRKDDMQIIYRAMKEADIIVFASPVYFYSWTATMKRVIDRSFAVEQLLTGKTFFLLTAGAAPEEKYYENMIRSYHLYIDCFRGRENKDGGYVISTGSSEPHDAVNSQALMMAYKLGKMEQYNS